MLKYVQIGHEEIYFFFTMKLVNYWNRFPRTEGDWNNYGDIQAADKQNSPSWNFEDVKEGKVGDFFIMYK